MGQGGVVTSMQDTPDMIDAMAKSIMNIPPAERESVIKQYERLDPETGKKLRKALEKMQKATTDMRPLPDQKPPRRAAKIV